jgi:hypothetical protein
MPPRTVRWARVADHYADLRGEADHFLALDGNVEVGVVKLVEMREHEEVWGAGIARGREPP